MAAVPAAPASVSASIKRNQRPLLMAVATLATLGLLAAVIVFAQVGRKPAAAAAAPAVATGNVTITSQPPGATVSIDSVTQGVTPLKLALPAGAHQLAITIGSSTREIPLSVDANTTLAQHFEFAPSAVAETGRLDVTSDPPGARVSVDGTARGTTPLSIASIAAGEHRVTISGDQINIQRSVTVAAGTTATVMATMTAAGSAGGWVQIKTPIELQVFEGGQLLGTTSASRLMLPAGRHDLEIVNTAAEFRAPLRVDIEPGKTSAPAVSIPNGVLSVNALPWAEVVIDGKPAGTTPLGNISLPIGSHEIVFRHPQLGERTRTVSVTARTPVRVGMDFSK